MRLFREHRGHLDDSLETMIEVNNLEQLYRHISRRLKPFNYRFPIERLAVRPYDTRPDLRIDPPWRQTFLVTLEGYGVVGYTNGPLGMSEVLQIEEPPQTQTLTEAIMRVKLMNMHPQTEERYPVVFRTIEVDGRTFEWNGKDFIMAH